MALKVSGQEALSRMYNIVLQIPVQTFQRWVPAQAGFVITLQHVCGDWVKAQGVWQACAHLIVLC